MFWKQEDVMDDYYIDNWGELKPKINLSNWSDFEPWQFWQTQFEWIECEDDLQEQDIIAFRDDVIHNHDDGSRTFRDGVRFNISRVANIKDDKAFLEIIHSEGEEPFEKDEHIYRSLKWLGRYGIQRWPREHSPTARVTPEQYEEGEKLKQEREENGRSGTAAGTGSYAQVFNRKRKKKKQDRSRFFSKPPGGKNRPLKP
jgi:hypothetical protein